MKLRNAELENSYIFIILRKLKILNVENSLHKIANILKIPNYKIAELENLRNNKIPEYQQQQKIILIKY